MTLAIEGLSRPVLAEASLAYGQHLVTVGQTGAAVDLLARTFRAVMAKPDGTDVRVAATLACEWGRALAARGQHADAIKRFEGAVAGYARTRQAELSAVVQRELSASLIALGETARAEDVLRRALATALASRQLETWTPMPPWMSLICSRIFMNCLSLASSQEIAATISTEKENNERAVQKTKQDGRGRHADLGQLLV